MEFLEELVNGFVIALLIVVLLGLFAATKEYRSRPIVMKPVTFISSFFSVKEKEIKEKNNRGEEKKAVQNRLYLLLMLNKDTTNIQRQISLLNEADKSVFKNVLEDPLMVENIERGVLGGYQLKSIGVFKIKSLLRHLGKDQMIELEKGERFLNKMGIDVYSDCNLDEELGAILDNMKLTEFFDKITKIKKITGMNYKEAFNLVKTKRAEYLQGILDFNLSEDQIDSVENMKEIYARINMKNVDKISFDGDQELDFIKMKDDNQDLDLEKLTKKQKKMPKDFLNDSIGKNTIQQAADENKVNLGLDKASASFELPTSESLNMIAFTKRTLRESSNDRAIDILSVFNGNIAAKPIIISKVNKNGKNKGSKR